ncbi:hypothetical protein E1B28_010449 [Marasmius oreades]|uniref:Uncharacterized protein n=1 Tax=Marasmius oreades TaxID=181124 RepID=A0A9P7UR54_9AGAR|nr:uncharacterized protein E1B28_010449 [Marasmius oreades]KAG7091412.1 hypothetical protein E1B28_010449 [Marasmius oreades]
MKTNMPLSRIPFQGPSRKLILGFDLGTTFSGVSYSVLEPGLTPEVRAVTRYPDQEHTGGDAKVPTLVYYDQIGKTKAIGATVLDPNIREEAKRCGWILCERFKLHLMPQGTLTPNENGDDLACPLPTGKEVEDVVADFYRFLFECSKQYITETVPDQSFWSSVESDVIFVLSHPNGWEGRQQNCLHTAAVKAGLIPDTPSGNDRLHLVTEGEACFHFCVNDVLSKIVIPNVDCVIIVDAGGGTVDISTYVTPDGSTVSETKDIEEVTTPQSICAGSITVTARAKCFSQKQFQAETQYQIDRIVDQFDKNTKLRFTAADRSLYLQIASFSGADHPDLGIRNGQMKLEGYEVEKFFIPSLKAIEGALRKQMKDAKMQKHVVKAVFLVGGFAANEWLYSKLTESLKSLNPAIALCRPQSSANKATADGAISSYLDDLVSLRVAKSTYGTICDIEYDKGNPEHVARADRVVRRYNGKNYLSDRFDIILLKGTKVHKTEPYKTTLLDDSLKKDELNSTNAKIVAYRGDLVPVPRFIDEDPDHFEDVCEVEADTTKLAKSLKARITRGQKRFELTYNVELSFGLTELAAQISWVENRKKKR